jgi:hypothetical protein
MSKALAERSAAWCTSIILGSDPIPHLSHASLENLMAELSEASPLKQGIDSIGQFWSSVISDLLGGNGGDSTTTATTTATTATAATASRATTEEEAGGTAPEMMFPAGTILWLDADGNLSFEFPFAGRLLLVESMLDDHLPDRYLASLMYGSSSSRGFVRSASLR